MFFTFTHHYKHHDMNRLLVAFSLCLLSLWTTAQKPMNVLDEAAASVRMAGNMKIGFTATTFSDGKELSSTTGTMLLKGKKMQLDTPEMKMWYDGTRQWTMLTGSDEVNSSIPTAKEMASVNPYSFISAYKKGYRMSMRETSLRGQQVYEIHMRATKTENPAQEIYVDVSKADSSPLCIRIRQDNEWNRISIHSLQGGMDFPDSDFTFPREQYPDCEIIEL